MRLAALLVLVALATAGCGEEETAQPLETGSAGTTTERRPTSFSETRSAILAAVEDDDYDALRPLLEPGTFLSDFGFGEEPDPVARWQAMGPEPLRTMGVLLNMNDVVQETNEGTLHQWPSYDPDSEPGDLSREDRKLFRTVLSEHELEQALTADYGYIGPRLGILEDGTWWFFILEGGP
jgi:hypothetical protein